MVSDLENLRGRIERMSNLDLARMLGPERETYRPEAIEIAEGIASGREGMEEAFAASELQPPPTPEPPPTPPTPKPPPDAEPQGEHAQWWTMRRDESVYEINYIDSRCVAAYRCHSADAVDEVQRRLRAGYSPYDLVHQPPPEGTLRSRLGSTVAAATAEWGRIGFVPVDEIEQWVAHGGMLTVHGRGEADETTLRYNSGLACDEAARHLERFFPHVDVVRQRPTRLQVRTYDFLWVGVLGVVLAILVVYLTVTRTGNLMFWVMAGVVGWALVLAVDNASKDVEAVRHADRRLVFTPTRRPDEAP